LRSSKAFFTTTKAPRIPEAFEKKERVFCSFGCAWNYLPSLLGASSRCKTKRFVWERTLVVKSEGERK